MTLGIDSVPDVAATFSSIMTWDTPKFSALSTRVFSSISSDSSGVELLSERDSVNKSLGMHNVVKRIRDLQNAYLNAPGQGVEVWGVFQADCRILFTITNFSSQ